MQHEHTRQTQLFNQSRTKSTYFLNRLELEKHVTQREELEFVGSPK